MNKNEEIDGAKHDVPHNQSGLRRTESLRRINYEILEEEKKEPHPSDISDSSYESGEELFRESALQRGKDYIDMLSLSKVQSMNSAKVI